MPHPQIATAMLALRWLWEINLNKEIQRITVEPPHQVAKIAQDTMVSIQGSKNFGSGFIVSQKGNTYYVLTAKHVVDKQGKYTLVTPDGKSYTLEEKDYHTKVRQLSNLDLAVVEFVSEDKYIVPELGDIPNLAEGTKLYLAGFFPWGKPSNLLRFTSGKVVDDPQGTNTLIYTNPTRPGLSGGQLLDEQGRIVGIHDGALGARQCRADGAYLGQKCQRTGLNFGIPMGTFIVIVTASHNRPNLQILDLRVDTATRRLWVEGSFASLHRQLKAFNSLGEMNCRGSDEVSYRSQKLKSPDSQTQVYFEAMWKRYGCTRAIIRNIKMIIESGDRVKFQHFLATDDYNFSNPLSYSPDGMYLIVAQNWSSGTERWNTFLFMDGRNNYRTLEIQSCQSAQFGGRFRGFKSPEDAVFECLDPESYWEIVNLPSGKISEFPHNAEVITSEYPSYGSIKERSQILRVEYLPRYYARAADKPLPGRRESNPLSIAAIAP
ncbi:MAG: trypsin-like peptidase domain-containing protein [Prochloron sp. SP5CPC1]|nr:trypsin-like peptidase domain-containing protein [Candidatus Paraprochloron terpiosi SP5CPC1]